MRSITGFLAAAGLALAAVPAAADPGVAWQGAYVGTSWDQVPNGAPTRAIAGAGVAQDAYVGTGWDRAPGGTPSRAAPGAGVAQDAYVGTGWDQLPRTEAPPAAAPAVAASGPRSSGCGCPCLARAR